MCRALGEPNSSVWIQKARNDCKLKEHEDPVAVEDLQKTNQLAKILIPPLFSTTVFFGLAARTLASICPLWTWVASQTLL